MYTECIHIGTLSYIHTYILNRCVYLCSSKDMYYNVQSCTALKLKLEMLKRLLTEE